MKEDSSKWGESNQIEKIRKNLVEAKLYEEACEKMIGSATTLNQYFLYRKTKMVMELKIQALSLALQNNIEVNKLERMTFKMSKLRLPILWTDEFKKRDYISAFAFFLLKHDTDFAESDLIELHTSSSQILGNSMKLLDVCEDSCIEISIYIYFVENAKEKKLTKHKLSEDFGNFRLLGYSKVVVSDLMNFKDIPFTFEFNINAESQKLKSVKNAFSLNLISPIVRTGSKTDLSTNMIYGVKFYHWNKAGAFISIFPSSIDCTFKKFNTPVIINQNESIKCIVFEKTLMQIYDAAETFMSNPVLSFSIQSLNISIDESSCDRVKIKDDITFATIRFKNNRIALKFVDYCISVQKHVDKWGINIDPQMNEKHVTSIITTMINDQASIMHILSRKDLKPTDIPEL